MLIRNFLEVDVKNPREIITGFINLADQANLVRSKNQKC